MMVTFRVGILGIKKTNKKNLYSNKDRENILEFLMQFRVLLRYIYFIII